MIKQIKCAISKAKLKMIVKVLTSKTALIFLHSSNCCHNFLLTIFKTIAFPRFFRDLIMKLTHNLAHVTH